MALRGHITLDPGTCDAGSFPCTIVVPAGPPTYIPNDPFPPPPPGYVPQDPTTPYFSLPDFLNLFHPGYVPPAKAPKPLTSPLVKPVPQAPPRPPPRPPAAIGGAPESPPPDWFKLANPDYVTAAGEASRAAQMSYQDVVSALARIGSGLMNFVNLMTYSPDAGLGQGVEEQLVAQQLGDLAFNELYASNPSEPDTDPYAEPIPFWYNPFPGADPQGLPGVSQPGVLQPSDFPGPLQEVTVQTSPDRAPATLAPLNFVSPLVLPLGLPGAMPAVGPLPRAAPRVAPGPKPGTAPSTRPTVGPRVRPGIALTPQVPGIAPGTDPFAGLDPKAGTKPDQNDCQTDCGGKRKKKDNKKRKRTVCHRGTYVELASGLLKFKKETIPCR